MDSQSNDREGEKRQIAIGIVGPGLIGKTLLSQLAQQVIILIVMNTNNWMPCPHVSLYRLATQLNPCVLMTDV